jgi:DNA gyrase subunit A
VVAIAQVHDNEELLVITEQGKILRTPANEIRTIGRATQGVRLMDLEGEDKIVSVALVEKAEDAPDVPGGSGEVPEGSGGVQGGSGGVQGGSGGVQGGSDDEA